MANPLLTFGVDNTAYVNVVIQTISNRCEIRDPAGVADLLVQVPANSGTPVTTPAPALWVFRPPVGKRYFAPGDIAGNVKLSAAGSTTLQQIETVEEAVEGTT